MLMLAIKYWTFWVLHTHKKTYVIILPTGGVFLMILIRWCEGDMKRFRLKREHGNPGQYNLGNVIMCNY